MIRVVNELKITVVDPKYEGVVSDVSTIAMRVAMDVCTKLLKERGIDCLLGSSGPQLDPWVIGVPDQNFHAVLSEIAGRHASTAACYDHSTVISGQSPVGS